MGLVIKGSELVAQSELETGLAHILQGLENLRALGCRPRLTYYLTLLVEAYRQRGQVAEGLRQLEIAFAEAEDTKERYWAAELYRLKGELLLLGTPVPVEAGGNLFSSGV